MLGFVKLGCADGRTVLVSRLLDLPIELRLLAVAQTGPVNLDDEFRLVGTASGSCPQISGRYADMQSVVLDQFVEFLRLQFCKLVKGRPRIGQSVCKRSPASAIFLTFR